jgi:hypothetical protein
LPSGTAARYSLATVAALPEVLPSGATRCRAHDFMMAGSNAVSFEPSSSLPAHAGRQTAMANPPTGE